MWRLGSGKPGSWKLLFLRRFFINAYQNILRKLLLEEIQYVVIGTWALKKKYPEILTSYPVKDCDLIIDPSLSAIRRSIKTLKSNSWSVSVWENEIDETVERCFLKGKFYLRARKSELTLDITYECPFIPWKDLWKSRAKKSDIPLASMNHILYLKELKGTDHDKDIIKLFRSIEPTRPAD